MSRIGKSERIRVRPFVRAAVVLTAMAMIGGLSGSAMAAGTFAKGDIFVGVASGNVQWYLPDGTLNETLNNTVGGFTTGMAFDSAGHLYVTNFSAGEDVGTPVHPSVPKGAGTGSVSEFDTDGTFLGFFGDGYNTPESILFDKSGNAYVGNVGGGTLKFSPSGNLLATFATGRTDWIDLAADQCTLFYTDESGVIHRYDVCSDSPLPDFASSGGQYALRLLPSGGLLVASSTSVNRFDDSGALIQSYDKAGEDSWFALNLDPDGTSFWSADFGTADVVKFDIASGDELQSFNTGTGTSTVFGLSVFGEITVGGGGGSADLSITKADSPDPVLVDGLLTYTITVTNNGPDEANNVVVSDDLPSGVTFDSASSECSGTKNISCDLGTLGASESATVEINVIANAAGTVKNTAEVGSSTADPDTGNNSDTASTTVNPAPSGGVQTGAGGTAPHGPGPLTVLVVALLVALGAFGIRRRARS